jgi:hypothetical protein
VGKWLRSRRGCSLDFLFQELLGRGRRIVFAMSRKWLDFGQLCGDLWLWDLQDVKARISIPASMARRKGMKPVESQSLSRIT